MNCIFLRRGYGTSGDGVNYVEWIKSDGASYFNTQYKPNQNTSVEMVVSGWDSSQKSSSVFGSRVSSSGTSYMMMINASGVYRSDYGSSQVTFAGGLSFADKVTILKEKNVTTIGDYSVTNTESTFSCTYPMYLFATNTGGSASHLSKTQIESCKIRESGTLIHHYRAAVDPDSVACFYDEVSKTYEYGIGTFTAGASTSGGGSGGGTAPTQYAVNLTGTLTDENGRITINGTQSTTGIVSSSNTA